MSQNWRANTRLTAILRIQHQAKKQQHNTTRMPKVRQTIDYRIRREIYNQTVETVGTEMDGGYDCKACFATEALVFLIYLSQLLCLFSWFKPSYVAGDWSERCINTGQITCRTKLDQNKAGKMVKWLPAALWCQGKYLVNGTPSSELHQNYY